MLPNKDKRVLDTQELFGTRLQNISYLTLSVILMLDRSIFLFKTMPYILRTFLYVIEMKMYKRL